MAEEFYIPPEWETPPSLNSDLARRNSRIFHSVAVITPLIAFGSYSLQTTEPLKNLAGIASTYAVGLLGVTALCIFIYLLTNRIVSHNLRKMKASEFYGHWHREYLRTLPVKDILAAYFGILITIPILSANKSYVISYKGFRFDDFFARVDRILFLGVDPWIVTHSIFASPWATKILDIIYHPTFIPMIGGYIVCIWARDYQALRYTYMSTFLISWVVISMFLAQAMISAGPIYDGMLWGDGTQFSKLKDQLYEQSKQQGPFFSLIGQEYLYNNHINGNLAPAGGISAMPSMHISLAMMWALVGWGVARWLGWVLSIYTFIIWVTSVHLGWHYAIDGLVSGVLTLGIWIIISRGFGHKIFAHNIMSEAEKN